MSDEPYLITHKVRSEPAFDIAIQMPCPECANAGCAECDGEGFWWICSTSGHRAYPYWFIALNEVYYEIEGDGHSGACPIDTSAIRMPEGIVDHYRVNASPRAKVADVGRSILASLGLTKPSAPIKRRI